VGAASPPENNWQREWGLAEGQAAQLDAILAFLAADETAPTAIRERSEAASGHIADSLVALEVEQLIGAGQIADLGSGAGFPGVALAVALQRAEIRLVESQRRRCAFLERMCAAAAISNAQAICARAEEWREGIEDNDAVVARALAPQPVVLEYAAPLLRLGGVLVDWRGAREGKAERAAAVAAQQLGLRLAEIRRVEPFEGARNRHLHVFEKVDATPARFPRRAGVARKRPLA
jgi:16S rRNA (guanine527-N7)-methyltransferase